MRYNFVTTTAAIFLLASATANAQDQSTPANAQSAPGLGAPVIPGAAANTQDQGGPAKVQTAPGILGNIFAPAPNGAGAARMWFSTDYLFWWTKGSPAPPLAVQGKDLSLNSTDTTKAPIPTSPGFIGLLTINNNYHLGTDNATAILFGNGSASPLASGARVTFGGWLDSDQTIGLEARYLFLDTTTTFHMPSGIVGVPYQNAANMQEASYPIRQPESITSLTRVYVNTTPGVFVHLYDATTADSAAGALSVRLSSVLQGGEANTVFNLGRGAGWRVEGLAGFRFVELDDTALIASNVFQSHTDTTTFEPALGLPTGKIPVVNSFSGVVSRTDDFQTHNSFYGGQIGARGSYAWDRLSLTVGGQVGFGIMHEVADIDGLTTTNGSYYSTPVQNIRLAGIPLTVASGAPGVTTKGINTTPGGLFAQPTNMGQHSHNVFAVVPEGLLQLNYRFTDRITGSLGYTFMYMSSVARAGDQINHTVSPSLLGTPPASGSGQPAFEFRSTDYWAQGINLGIQVQY